MPFRRRLNTSRLRLAKIQSKTAAYAGLADCYLTGGREDQPKEVIRRRGRSFEGAGNRSGSRRSPQHVGGREVAMTSIGEVRRKNSSGPLRRTRIMRRLICAMANIYRFGRGSTTLFAKPDEPSSWILFRRRPQEHSTRALLGASV